MKKIGFALFGFVCFQHIAFSQDTSNLEDKLMLEEELLPTEISAVYATQKSPFSVSNLSLKKIEKNNLGQDIPYILNQTPSVIINSDAGNGIGYTSMRIRGTDMQRINFTINGIPINDAESQGTFFVNFPDLLSSAGTIQVQRGVGSSTNGTGAFGASINVSNLFISPTPYFSLSNSFGSFNSFRNTLKAGTGLLSNGLQFDIRLSKISSDGYIDRSNSDLKAAQFLAGWTSKNQQTNIRANIFTGIQKTGQAWNGIEQDSLYTNRRYNPLGIMEDGKYYHNQTDNYQQDYYQLFIDQKVNNWNLHAGIFLTRGKGYYDEYRTDESFEDYNRKPFIVQNDTLTSTNLTRQLWLDNYNYGLVYNANYKTDKTDFIIGGNFINYEGDHYGKVTWAQYGFPNNFEWYNLASQKSDINVFAKINQQIASKWFAMLDLQYRNVHYKTEGFRKNPTVAKDVTYNFFNPKAGISYINNTKSYFEKAYLSFAVANKEPNRNDFENLATNPLAESLYNAELGYQYQNNQFHLEFNYYYMYYKNQLINDGKINDVGAYTRINTPQSYRTGLEFSITYKALKWLEVNVNSTYSINKIINFSEYIDNYDSGTQDKIDYGNTPIAFAPNFIASINASVQPFINKEIPLYADFIYKYISRQFLDNTGNIDRSINPYGLMDIKLRYSLQYKQSSNIDFHIALNNVFNKMYEANGYTFSYVYNSKQYTSNYYFPQAGFNFMLGVNFQIGK